MIKMKNITKIAKFFAFIALVVLLNACSNKMTREKAKEIISQKYEFPSTVTEEFPYGEVNYDKVAQIEAEKFLQRENLITLDYKGKAMNTFSRAVVYDLQFTSKGKNYVIGQNTNKHGRSFYTVKVADRIFVDINGIRELSNGKSVQVEFSWKYENVTPFGKAMNLENSKRGSFEKVFIRHYNDSEIHTKTVMMVLYDDGWRIQ